MERPKRKIKQRISRGTRGFSLLEVMVATAIFATTAMGLVALNKVALNASVYGRERTAAANLAQYAMTWLENEVAAFASSEPDATAVNDPFFSKLKESAAPASPVTDWVSLSGAGTSLRFDEYLSNQTDSKYTTVNTAKYCVHYRVLLTNGPGSTRLLPGNLYHASVLVTWPKEKHYVTDDGNWTDCADHLADTSAADGDVLSHYNSMLLSQILTRDFSNKIVEEQ